MVRVCCVARCESLHTRDSGQSETARQPLGIPLKSTPEDGVCFVTRVEVLLDLHSISS